MLREGIKNKKCLTVGDGETALHMGSGSLPVFATPAMIALMEATAAESIEPLLDAGMTSVGVKITVDHLSPDTVGETVLCESILTAVDGRKYVFKLTVRDSSGLVGEGTHERVAVFAESFMKKATAKRCLKGDERHD